MPELPDLQAFAKNLNRLFAGETVSNVILKSKKSKVSAATLKKKLVGAKLKSFYREGKQLYIDFDNDAIIALHLMLHGELKQFDKKNDHKYTVLELAFNSDKGLALTDWQNSANVTLDPSTPEAPDAMSKKVNSAFLKEALDSKASLKNILMDQQVIRGIGNAYADEILWEAGLSPFCIGNKVPDKKIAALAKAIKSVLKDAEKQILKADPNIITGEIRTFLKIHNARKKESPRGEEILNATVGGRKTYYTAGQELFQ